MILFSLRKSHDSATLFIFLSSKIKKPCHIIIDRVGRFFSLPYMGRTTTRFLYVNQHVGLRLLPILGKVKVYYDHQRAA